MQIRVGYELVYDCPQPTPMVVMLSVHPSRAADLLNADQLRVQPELPITQYRDVFDNVCNRIVTPRGKLRLTSDCIVKDNGLPEPVAMNARPLPVQHLPAG